jgi:hypothetical protein
LHRVTCWLVGRKGGGLSWLHNLHASLRHVVFLMSTTNVVVGHALGFVVMALSVVFII